MKEIIGLCLQERLTGAQYEVQSIFNILDIVDFSIWKGREM